jgi:addiction module RelE/StbE family toxin
MPYFIDLSDEAKARLKKLKKTDPALATRIAKKFDVIAENPTHFEILSGDLHDARSAPVGTKYRIIYDVFEEEESIKILLFGHHKYIYSENKLFDAFFNSEKRNELV